MIDKVLTIPSIRKKIDQQLVNQYAIAANDPNPIHTDPNIAQHTIFKKPVAHGSSSENYRRYNTLSTMRLNLLAPY